PLGNHHQAADGLRQRRITDGEEPADIPERIFLRAHQDSVAEGKHLAGDITDASVLAAALPLPDEERILREPGRVEEKGDPARLENAADAADVLHWDGLSSHRVARGGQDDQAHPVGAYI